MASLILPRPNKLIYPGTKPGIDPTHPASKNCLIAATAVSTPAGSANFYNAATGKVGTPTGSGVLSTAMFGGLGPSMFMNANTADNVTFPGTYSSAGGGLTLAAIFAPLADTGFVEYFIADAVSGNNGFGTSQAGSYGTLQFLFQGLSGDTGLNITSTRVPYFCVLSASANSSVPTVAVVVNLSTGQTFTYQAVTTLVPAAGGGTIYIGNRGAARNWDGWIAAASYSNTYLNLNQLLAWADNPWSFWYPQKFDIAEVLTADAAVVPTQVSGTPGIYEPKWRLLPPTPGRLPWGVTRGLTNRIPLDEASFDNIARDIVGGTYLIKDVTTPPFVPLSATATSSALSSATPASTRGVQFGIDATGAANATNELNWLTSPIPAAPWTGTISHWVYIDAWGAVLDGNDPRIVCIGGSAQQIQTYVFSDASARWGFEADQITMSRFDVASLGSSVFLGQWNHLVATFDGSTITLYTNGVNTSDVAGSGSGLSTPRAGVYSIGGRGLTIGGGGGSDRTFGGRVADVRIYTGTVLTPAEISQLYNSAFTVDEVLPALSVAAPSVLAAASPLMFGPPVGRMAGYRNLLNAAKPTIVVAAPTTGGNLPTMGVG